MKKKLALLFFGGLLLVLGFGVVGSIGNVYASQNSEMILVNREGGASQFVVESFGRQAIEKAITEGVSLDTITLLLLLPLVASLVAFSRQVIGLNGFGMISPLLLTTAFLSTGGLVGTLMLVFVVGLSILFKAIIKKIRIPYLPKLAILLWMILIAVLVMILGGFGGFWSGLTSVGIFPIILFVSVAETFIETQITRSFGVSLKMLLETVVLSVLGYLVVSSQVVRSIALLNPELWLALVLAVNLLIARYKGLRLLEVWRFRKIILR